MHGWRRGLKTGLYYLRSKPAKEAVKVTVDPTLERAATQELVNKQLGAATTEEEEEGGDEGAAIPEGWVCRKEEGCVQCSG